MNIKSPFTVDHSQLGNLRADDATNLFREILWAEVSRVGLSAHRIQISLSNTVADGGIDARISGTPKVDSILCSGDTHFQIKSGTSFKPWLKSCIQKELFGTPKAAQTKKNLAPAVSACCDVKGRYALVTFGHDLTPTQITASKKLLSEALRKCGYKKVEIEVVGQTQLAALVRVLPAILHRLQGLADRFFLDYATWKHQDLMSPGLELGEAQEKFLKQVRTALESEKVQHVRIIGEPGIGKTRLALEALSPEKFSCRTLYAPLGEDFNRSQLLLDLVKAGDEVQAILVVDDCPEKERASIWSALKGKRGIRLVSLDHGPERARDDAMLVLHCPPLSDKEIEKILGSYISAPRFLSRWAAMCEGSPRVAHAVGENLQHHPDDVLKPPATVPIWDRFITGYQGIDGAFARQTLIVMRHIALFEKFGFDAPVESEGRYIAELVRAADPTITWPIFQEHIQHLRDRRILQGKRTLVIVPRLLHIYLWLSYWEAHGRGFNFAAFLEEMPESLNRWFTNLFSYAHANIVSLTVVRRLLDHGGPFDRPEFLSSDDGARLLGSLGEADPGAAGRLLQRTLATWPAEDLKAWTSGRQRIVWALEKIAVWHEHFATAVKVLIPMALNENASNSNNSTGVLRALFVIGMGWAPTQAPPDERHLIVTELLSSPDAERRSLALRLCSAWFTTHGGSRIVGAEHQGLRDELPFWRPKKYGEVFDAWRVMWRSLYSLTRSWADSERGAANGVLIESGARLLYMASMADEVMDTWHRLAKDSATSLEALTHAIINARRLHNRKLPKGILGRLQKLDAAITGTSFWTRFQRFVLFPTWEESYRVGREDNDEAFLTKRIVKLAKELAKSPRMITTNLPRLVVAKGRCLWVFGQKFGLEASSPALTKKILDEQIRALPDLDAQFISGYMSAWKYLHPEEWDAMVIHLLRNPSTQPVGEAIVRGCGFSGGILPEMIRMLKEGSLGISVFHALVWRSDRDELAPKLAAEILESLCRLGTPEAYAMAIELAHMYYCEGKRLRPFSDESIVENLILSTELLVQTKGSSVGYHWKHVVEEFCRRFPDRELVIFARLLAIFEEVDVWRRDELVQITYEIAKRRPTDAWELVARKLELRDGYSYNTKTWLGGQPTFEDEGSVGAIQSFDAATIIAWIKDDPDSRAGLILRCLPRSLASGAEGELTRRFIEEVLPEDDIASLVSHFIYSGGFSGPESEYLRRKRDTARKWLGERPSAKIAGFLTRFISTLEQDIESAEIGEERRGY